MSCPLCQNSDTTFYFQDSIREYLQCSECSLVFVSRNLLISADQERLRYEQHYNSEENQGYLNYLDTIAKNIIPNLKQGSHGLDFGCGRSKLMGEIFSCSGFEMSSFDLYFHPDPLVLEKKYDFIILSEVIEHLRSPDQELKMLRMLLNPHGSIFIKTKFYPGSKTEFASWFYKRDITHVQFFSLKAMQILAKALNCSMPAQLDEDLYQLELRN